MSPERTHTHRDPQSKCKTAKYVSSLIHREFHLTGQIMLPNYLLYMDEDQSLNEKNPLRTDLEIYESDAEQNFTVKYSYNHTHAHTLHLYTHILLIHASTHTQALLCVITYHECVIEQMNITKHLCLSLSLCSSGTLTICPPLIKCQMPLSFYLVINMGSATGLAQ